MGILLVLGILCIVGAAVLAVAAFLPGKPAAEKITEDSSIPEKDTAPEADGTQQPSADALIAPETADGSTEGEE